MHTHIEAVKAKLGLKTDREFAQMFDKPKSVRTVQAWKQNGMAGWAVRELHQICIARGVRLDAELSSGLSLGVPQEPHSADDRGDAAA